MREDDPERATEDDPPLVEAARSGDPRALAVLVSRHRAAAWRLALRLTGDESMASDATQDGFLKAFRGLDEFRGDAAFRTWLLVIVANEARGMLRKRARRRESPLEDVGPLSSGGADVAEGVVLRDEAARIRRQVQELPEKQRLAVSLRLEEGLSFREIGRLIGSSGGAARVNYHHGVRRLRDKPRDL